MLPRSIATKAAFCNAMSLDVAMGGSTNTVLHILATAIEGEVDFTLEDIDRISRTVPCLSKVAPNGTAHVEQKRAQAKASLVARVALDLHGPARWHRD